MAFNLHALARGAVMAVHPEVPVVAIFCTGFIANHGQRIMKYGDCERVSAQKQTLNGDDVQLSGEIMQAELSRKFFLSTQRALTAGRRHDGEGASWLYELNTGDWWRVFNVTEDFSNVGWQQVFASHVPAPPEDVVRALRDSGIGGPTEGVFHAI